GIDLSKDSLAIQRLKEAAEKAKIELSSSQETEINLPFITSGQSGPQHLYYKLTRSELENLVREYIDRSIDLIKQTMKEAGLEPKDLEEIVLVGGQTRMPAMQEAVKNFFGKEPNKSVNPDEVVAIGAAIQGGVLGGEVKDVLLLDVTPLTLGIETLGSVRTPLIERNTTVPTSKTQIFSTAADNQTQVEINILQGERPMAVDNKTLGRFVLDGIPPAPRGVPQIEVTFDIDANGILNVKAVDKATNKVQSIVIRGAVGLSDEEVKTAQAEAEKYAEADRTKKEAVEARNQADGLVFTAEKTLKDAGDKVKPEDKEKVEAEIKNVKDLLAKADTAKEALDEATKKLSEELQKVGAAMYQNQKPPAGEEKKEETPPTKDKAEEGEVVS
ncbi:MAG: Hsp70 family protein, partial [bacterium]|nr:Hsp70 family protein [bacterium]